MAPPPLAAEAEASPGQRLSPWVLGPGPLVQIPHLPLSSSVTFGWQFCLSGPQFPQIVKWAL